VVTISANPAAIKARGGGAVEERKSFGTVLRDLLIDRGYTTAIGNPNWSRIADELGDVQYESLRKAITGERLASAKIMERVAQQLDVEPSVFWEYNLWLVQRAFDPKEVGEEKAFENLRKWMKK